jgi:type II secretory pathway predicted ATPase ExeA
MIEQDDEKRISVQEDKNGDVFFYEGAGRGEALEQLWDGIVRDIPILTLTGAQGSGKSTLCRRFIDGIPVDCLTVYFSETVESFEEIVTTVAENLGLAVNSSGTGRYIESLVEQISDHLLSQPLRLVLVFDEAENLYLATLERVRRMLDKVRQSAAPLHILFAGRRTFLENCEQLSICDFVVTEECRVQLDPLEDFETAELIHQFLEEADDASVRAEMTDETVAALFEAAKGNLGRTLELVAKQETVLTDDSSFMTLAGAVNEETVASKEMEVPPLATRFANFKSYIPWIGGAVGVTVVALLLLGKPEKADNDIPSGQAKEVALEAAEKPSRQTQEAVAMTPKPDVVTVAPTPEKKSVAEQAPPASATTAAKPGKSNLPAPKTEEPKASAAAASSAPTELPKAQENLVSPVVTAANDQPKAVADQPAKKVKIPKPAPPESQSANKASPSRIVIKGPIEQREVQTIEAKSGKVVTLVPEPDWKIRPDSEAEPETAKPARNEAKEVAPGKARLTAQQLLMKRMQAGSPWVVGVKDEKYTVQVMVLTSRNAEDNIREMLEQQRYRQEAGNFYVFRKGGNPPQLFVFYGEYDTAEEAKHAHDSLPLFLREHSSPYVISVKEAIAKIL